jgi:hypothetical protein
MASVQAQGAGQSQRSKAAAAMGSGFDNTNPTGSRGDLVPPPTAKTGLMGA